MSVPLITSGLYIAVEGTEGCGKSTHTAVLADQLGAVLTRESGGTRIGRSIRVVLADTANEELDMIAEAALLAADRAQHWAEVVGPALAADRIVMSDRSAYSSLAYQVYGRGLDESFVTSMSNAALRGRWPDLVLWFDADPEILERRIRSRAELDRFEMAGDEFFGRVHNGFASMAQADPLRWIRVDTSGSKDDTRHRIESSLRSRCQIGDRVAARLSDALGATVGR